MEPLHSWTPTIGVCGMDYYNHDAIPEWKNSLLIVALQSGAGEYGQRMYQFPIDPKTKDARLKEDFLSYSFGRLRDVLVAPDGRGVHLHLQCGIQRQWMGSGQISR